MERAMAENPMKSFMIRDNVISGRFEVLVGAECGERIANNTLKAAVRGSHRFEKGDGIICGSPELEFEVDEIAPHK